MGRDNLLYGALCVCRSDGGARWLHPEGQAREEDDGGPRDLKKGWGRAVDDESAPFAGRPEGGGGGARRQRAAGGGRRGNRSAPAISFPCPTRRRPTDPTTAHDDSMDRNDRLETLAALRIDGGRRQAAKEGDRLKRAGAAAQRPAPQDPRAPPPLFKLADHPLIG